MTQPLHDLANRFIAALSAGMLPDDLLTDDMQTWTTPSGQWSDRARYQGGVQMLGALYQDGLQYQADSITAENDRIAIEAQAHGVFADNGEPYANRYVFILTVRDGRIATVAEHCHPGPVDTAIRPRLIAAMQRAAAG